MSANPSSTRQSHLQDKQYIDSCAYHEAAHTVVAVALEMPLRNRGVHIDGMGNGISYYWFRTPGDPSNTPQDIVERERTIVSTEAGYIAQRKFYPVCPSGGNWYDRDLCIKLMDEMYPHGGSERFAAHDRLIAEASGLVDEHGLATEALAKAVLDQPWTTRPEDTERQWSKDTVEKWIDGNRVVSILTKFHLEPIIRDEAPGKFYPNVEEGGMGI
jgi:hypothetical protein